MIQMRLQKGYVPIVVYPGLSLLKKEDDLFKRWCTGSIQQKAQNLEECWCVNIHEVNTLVNIIRNGIGILLSSTGSSYFFGFH